MPIGEFRSWARLKLARVLGSDDDVDNAERRFDTHWAGFFRRAEKQYNYRLSQLEGFYHYNALPILPKGMPEEIAYRNMTVDRCKYKYNELDHCLFRYTERDKIALKMPFTRLQCCKKDFTKYMRCIINRDISIYRNIEAWERKYLKTLTSNQRAEYLDKMKQKAEYYDYMDNITDRDKRISCYYEKRQKEHQRRYNYVSDLVDELEGRPVNIDRMKLRRSSHPMKSRYNVQQH